MTFPPVEGINTNMSIRPLYPDDRWTLYGSDEEILMRVYLTPTAHNVDPFELLEIRQETLNDISEDMAPYFWSVAQHGLGTALMNVAHAFLDGRYLFQALDSFDKAKSVLEKHDLLSFRPEYIEIPQFTKHPLMWNLSEFRSLYNIVKKVRYSLIGAPESTDYYESLMFFGEAQLYLSELNSDPDLVNDAYEVLNKAQLGFDRNSYQNVTFTIFCIGKAFHSLDSVSGTMSLQLAMSYYYDALKQIEFLNDITEDGILGDDGILQENEFNEDYERMFKQDRVLKVEILCKLAQASARLGLVRSEADPLFRAIVAYQSALEEAVRVDDTHTLMLAERAKGYVLHILGKIAYNKQSICDGISSFDRALSLSDRFDSNGMDKSEILGMRGSALADLLDLTNSPKYLAEAIDCLDKSDLASPTELWTIRKISFFCVALECMVKLSEITKDTSFIKGFISDPQMMEELPKKGQDPHAWAYIRALRGRMEVCLFEETRDESYLISALSYFRQYNEECEEGKFGNPALLGSRRSLGIFLFRLGYWAEAISVFRELADGVGASLLVAETYLERRRLLEYLNRVGDRIAYALFRSGRYDEAWQELNLSRAILLSSTISHETLVARMNAPRKPSYNRLERVFNEQNFESALWEKTRNPDADVSSWISEDLNYDVISPYPGIAGPIEELTGSFLFNILRSDDWSEAASEAIPWDSFLVAPIYTREQGGGALIRGHKQESFDETDSVLLESFSSHLVYDLVFGKNGWLAAQDRLKNAIKTKNNDVLSEEIDFCSNAVENITSVLWEEIMGPIDENLRFYGAPAGSPIILMVSGPLSTLPLHAAWHLNSEGHREYFLENWTPSYIPSASALVSCHRRNQERGEIPDSMLSIVNPTQDFPDWMNPGWELFDADKRQRLESGATVASVCTALPNHTHLNFFCHGQWNREHPMMSGLQLAGKNEFLSVNDLRKLDLKQSRLAILGACESGLTNVDFLPDELLGLPGAMLEIGVPAVLSTQWLVEPNITHALIERFLEYQLNGFTPATALRQTQLELLYVGRKKMGDPRAIEPLQKPFDSNFTHTFEGEFMKLSATVKEFDLSNPFFWSGYTVTGL